MQGFSYILLSLVQAATEFLPVSSSGHLLFIKGLFHVEDIPIIFDIIIHVGSLVAILLFYKKKIFVTFKNSWTEIVGNDKKKTHSTFLLYACITTVVTFVFFILFKDFIVSRYQKPSILVYSYMVTTVILFSTIYVEKKCKHCVTDKGWILPILVGLFQGFAIMPGISRSGSTISSLLFMGVKKEDAAYFSFFLAIPAIIGALLFNLVELENLKFLKENAGLVLISFVISVLFSYLFLNLLTLILKRGRFWMFSIYTLGMVILALFLF